MSSQASVIISEYFKKNPNGAKRFFLVVDESSTTRNGIRRYLTEQGVAHTKVFAVETMNEAKDIIRTERINSLICAQKFPGGTLPQLLDFLFSEKHLSAADTWISCLPTLRMSEVNAQLASDVRVDQILPRPFTFERMAKGIHELIQLKGDSTRGATRAALIQALTLQIKGLENLGQPQIALKQVQTLLRQYPDSPAIQIAGIRLQLTREYSALHADDLFITLQTAIDSHMMSPHWIPDVIRWALADKRQSILESLLELVMDLPQEEKPSLFRNQISQGMVEYAHMILQPNAGPLTDDSKRAAFDWIKKALRLADGTLETYRPILAILQKAKMYSEIELLLAASPEAVRDSIESQIIYLQNLEYHQESTRVVDRAQDLISKKILAPEIFELLIRHSKLMGRPSRIVDNVIQQAVAAFPSERARFEKESG